MEKRMLLKMKEKNKSSKRIILVVALMLIVVALLAILPPVLTRHRSTNINPNTSHVESGGGNGDGAVLEGEGAPSTTVSPEQSIDPLVVKTQYGAIRGIYEDGVRVFHGVPFAKPPVGDLRWKPPEDVQPWSPKVYNATQPRPGCPQICKLPFFCPDSTSEDCLYLEIFTPVPPPTLTSALPVMLYIHGGSFQDMSSTSPGLYPARFVQRAGVIVVMMEYRLGVLGFLVTGEGQDQATGNYGIQDQILAIKWVRENIAAFGGDPEKVTLAGQSAGSQGVLIHLTSENSSQYFRSVIVESPPLTLPYKTTPEAANQGTALAKLLNCVNASGEISIACLKQKDTSDILQAQTTVAAQLEKYMDRLEPWGPVIDNKFVNAQTLNSMLDFVTQSKHRKPMIWGQVTEETRMFIYGLLATPLPSLFYEVGLSALFPDLAPEIKKVYPATGQTDAREEMVVLATDIIFRCPIRNMLRSISEAWNDVGVWSYTWNVSIEGDIPKSFAVCEDRVCHGTEVPFVFQSFSKVNITPTEAEINLSNSIIVYYSHFIHHQDPNVAWSASGAAGTHSSQLPRDTNPLWPNISSGQHDRSISELLFTGHNQITVREGKEKDEGCDFWDAKGYSLIFP